MSRAIQIRVSESLVRTVHVEDGVQSPLELLPILAKDRLGELLAVELEALGFVRQGDLATRSDPDGIVVEVDLRAATVTVKLGATSRVEESLELTRSTAEELSAGAEDRLRGEAIKELDARLDRRTEALRRKVTATLEAKLGDLKAELDGAIGRTTVAALTERAGQLGQIESVVGDEAGNVTIRVKL